MVIFTRQLDEIENHLRDWPLGMPVRGYLDWVN